MKGRNEIQFNYATMNEAVQYYLDNVVFRTIGSEVVDVTEHKNDNCFVIRIEETELEDGK